jgi:tetratricopeptide (TPR) repeat protein
VAIVVTVVGLGTAACNSSTPPPPNAAKIFAQGLKAQTAGDLTTARADYNKVIADDPTNHYGKNLYAYYDLGVMDQDAGNATAAAAEYRKSLLISPNYTSALFNLAIVETPTSPSSAILLYNQILAINPKDPNTLYNLGLLLYNENEIAQGQQLLNEAILIAPTLRAKLPASVKL